MAQLNAQAVAAKWQSRMSAAGENIKSSVQTMTQNPAELAAQAKDRWIAGVQKAASEGKFENGLANVSLQDWQRAMVNKGIPNMLTGAREAQTKVQRFMQELLPYAADVSAKIRSMPKGTDQDGEARALETIRMMRRFRKRS